MTAYDVRISDWSSDGALPILGAISVPMFTLFGLDGLRLRLDDCKPKLLITNAEKAEIARQIDGVRVIVADDALLAEMAGLPDTFETKTRADDMAVFQYTSGTTRELPAAVKHTHTIGRASGRGRVCQSV